MNLNQLFKKYSKQEKHNFLKLGIVSSNSLILDYLNKSREKISLDQDDLFMICRQATAKSFQYLKGKVDFNKLKFNQQQNTCVHIAGQYGNVQALKYFKQKGFDFSTLNKKHQTALAHSLKNNQYSFEQTISYLGKITPIGIFDGDNNLSYQVNIPLDQSRARLLQWLKDKESGL